jgi:hypothetical protein
MKKEIKKQSDDNDKIKIKKKKKKRVKKNLYPGNYHQPKRILREHIDNIDSRLKKIICSVKRQKYFNGVYRVPAYQSFISSISSKFSAKYPKITSDVCLFSNIQISTGFTAG